MRRTFPEDVKAGPDRKPGEGSARRALVTSQPRPAVARFAGGDGRVGRGTAVGRGAVRLRAAAGLARLGFCRPHRPSGAAGGAAAFVHLEAAQRAVRVAYAREWIPGGRPGIERPLGGLLDARQGSRHGLGGSCAGASHAKKGARQRKPEPFARQSLPVSHSHCSILARLNPVVASEVQLAHA